MVELLPTRMVPSYSSRRAELKGTKNIGNGNWSEEILPFKVWSTETLTSICWRKAANCAARFGQQGHRTVAFLLVQQVETIDGRKWFKRRGPRVRKKEEREKKKRERERERVTMRESGLVPLGRSWKGDFKNGSILLKTPLPIFNSFQIKPLRL